MDFFDENWLVLISLGIALIGGAPGVISVINHFQQDERLSFKITSFIIGEYTLNNPPERVRMFLLSGSLSNKGLKPVSPDFFHLRIKIKNKWIEMQRMLLSENNVFQGDNVDYKFENLTKRDLHLFNQKIEYMEPIYGHFMFLTGDVPRDVLKNEKNIKMKLTCNDVLGTVHKVDIIKANFIVEQETYFPKLEMMIIPKK